MSGRIRTTLALQSALNAFSRVQPDLGTSPVADSPDDTLTLTSSDSSILITGDSSTDTVDFTLNGAAIGNAFTTMAVPNGTNPVADGPNDTLTWIEGSGAITITGDQTTDSITIDVDQSAIDHGNLAGLADDDHLQYMLAESSVTDRAIVLWDGTGGRNVQNSVVTISGGGLVQGVTQLNIGSSIYASGGITADTDFTFTSNSGQFIFADDAFFPDNVAIEWGNTAAAPDIRMVYDGTTFNIDGRVGTLNTVVFGENASNVDGRVRIFRLGLGGSDVSNSAYLNADLSAGGTGRNILNFSIRYQGSLAGVGAQIINVIDEGGATGAVMFGINNSLELNTIAHTTYTQIGYDCTLGTNAAIAFPVGKAYDFFGHRIKHENGGGSHTGGDVRTFGILQEPIVAYSGVDSQLIYGAFFSDQVGILSGEKLMLDATVTAEGDSYFQHSSGEILTVVDGTSAFDFGTTFNQSHLPLVWPYKRTVVSDTDHSVVATDQVIAYTALTADRTVTLPLANSVPSGFWIIVKDEVGAASSHTINISPSGSDTIQGVTTVALAGNYATVRLYSNGSNAWFTGG